MTTYLAHIKKHQDAAGRIAGPVAPPIAAKYREMRPDWLAFKASPAAAHDALAKAQADVEYLAAALQAVLNEVHPHVRGTSADSWLPEEIVVQCLSALGYDPELPA